MEGIHSIPDRSILASLLPLRYHPSSHKQPIFNFLEQSMTITKAHIVEALFAKNIFTKPESAQIIDTLFELIKQSLQNGQDVLISGFGKFLVKEKQARKGRNPKTGKAMSLPPRKVVTFKCSGVLRVGMNGKGD
jgi:integration host factor subunit alpha